MRYIHTYVRFVMVKKMCYVCFLNFKGIVESPDEYICASNRILYLFFDFFVAVILHEGASVGLFGFGVFYPACDGLLEFPDDR